MKKQFETEGDKQLAISSFKQLKANNGWRLLVDIVEANIEELTNQILDGFEGETKERIDRKRDKIRAYKDIIGTPDSWIERLSTKTTEIEQSDPYITKEDLEKARKYKI